jgi:arylsulfatase
MLFTDYYAEASYTAGRANFITGNLPNRTGMTGDRFPTNNPNLRK